VTCLSSDCRGERSSTCGSLLAGRTRTSRQVPAAGWTASVAGALRSAAAADADASTLFRRRRTTFPTIAGGGSGRTFSSEPTLNRRRRCLTGSAVGSRVDRGTAARGAGGSEAARNVNWAVEVARPPEAVSTVTQPTHGRHADVVQTSRSDDM